MLVFRENDLLALMLNYNAVGGGLEASSRPMSAGGAARAPLHRSAKSIAKPRPADYPKIAFASNLGASPLFTHAY